MHRKPSVDHTHADIAHWGLVGNHDYDQAAYRGKHARGVISTTGIRDIVGALADKVTGGKIGRHHELHVPEASSDTILPVEIELTKPETATAIGSTAVSGEVMAKLPRQRQGSDTGSMPRIG